MCAFCHRILCRSSSADGRDPRSRIHPFVSATQEFINASRAAGFYLLRHYIREGKSYLTISFGARAGSTVGMIAEDVNKRLRKAGYK